MKITIKNSLFLVFKLWIKATFRPLKVFKEIASEKNTLEVSFFMMLIFSFLYTITAIILCFNNFTPAIRPWLPVSKEDYYFYQIFWTIPWGLSTWILISGITHVLAILGRDSDLPAKYEYGLFISGIAWILPSLYFMWIPETLLALLKIRYPFPFVIEVFRLMIIAPVWQVLLVAYGCRILYGTSLYRGFFIGLITLAITFFMFLVFMR